MTAVRRAVLGMMAVHRLQDHNAAPHQDADKEQLAKDVEQYKNEAERVGLLPDERLMLRDRC